MEETHSNSIPVKGDDWKEENFLITTEEENTETEDNSIFFYLKELNGTSRDARIQLMPATHTYFVDGEDQGYMSVSTFVKSFFPEFKAKEVIAKMRKGKNFAQSKYASMTDDEIKRKWDDEGKFSSEVGTTMHSNIEKFYNMFAKQGYKTSAELLSVLPKGREYEQFRLWHEKWIQPLHDSGNGRVFRTEKQVFLEEYKLAGTIDILFDITKPDSDPGSPKQMWLLDWKRCKEFKGKNYWQKGFGPLNEFDDCNLVHYAVNLSLYRYILDVTENIKVPLHGLVRLHPDSDCEFCQTPYLIDYIPDMLAFRKKQLEAIKNGLPMPLPQDQCSVSST